MVQGRDFRSYDVNEAFRRACRDVPSSGTGVHQEFVVQASEREAALESPESLIQGVPKGEVANRRHDSPAAIALALSVLKRRETRLW